MTEIPPPNSVWDLLCVNNFETIWVQVYSSKERSKIDGHLKLPKYARAEIVKYYPNQDGDVPVNRIIYPTQPT